MNWGRNLLRALYATFLSDSAIESVNGGQGERGWKFHHGIDERAPCLLWGNFDLADGLALTEKRGDGTAYCATSSANHLLSPPPPLSSGSRRGRQCNYRSCRAAGRRRWDDTAFGERKWSEKVGSFIVLGTIVMIIDDGNLGRGSRGQSKYSSGRESHGSDGNHGRGGRVCVCSEQRPERCERSCNLSPLER